MKTILAALAAAVVAACSGGGDYTPAEGEVALGSADAPVTVVEYLSATCGVCAAFHSDVFKQTRAEFIDTGRVRWVFRELTTAPHAVSLASFQIARCGGATPEQYAARLDVIFQQQGNLVRGFEGAVRDQLVAIGQASGLSREQAEACIDDDAGAARIQAMQTLAQADGATGTPTILINGDLYTPAGPYTFEDFATALNDRLGGAQ